MLQCLCRCRLLSIATLATTHSTYTHTVIQIEPKQQRTNDEKLKIMFMLLFAFAIFAISLLYALYCVPFPTFVPLSLPPFHTLPYTYVCTYILFPLFSLCFLFSFSCFTGTCTVGSLGLLRWVQSHRAGSAVGGRATDSDHTACHWAQGCEILFRGYNA